MAKSRIKRLKRYIIIKLGGYPDKEEVIRLQEKEVKVPEYKFLPAGAVPQPLYRVSHSSGYHTSRRSINFVTADKKIVEDFLVRFPTASAVMSMAWCVDGEYFAPAASQKIEVIKSYDEIKEYK